MPEQKRKEGLSKSLRTFFGVGDLGFSWMTNIETYYFQFFLTNVAQFTLPIVTLISTIASIVDAALSWIYGIILNKAKPMKWGRYRSWLLVVPWIVPFLYAFQFIKLSDGPLGIVVIILAAILSHVAWNIPFIANISMINIAAKTPEERMALSSTRGIWQSLGRVTYSYGGTAFVAVAAGIVGEKNAYCAAAFCFGAMMAVLYFVHFKMFDGYEESGQEEIERLKREQLKAEKEQPSDKGGKKPTLLNCLTENPYLFAWMLTDLSKYMYSFIANGIATYYFTYVAKSAGMTATYIFASNLLGVVAGYLLKPLSKKIQARSVIIYAYIAQIIVMVLGFTSYQKPLIVLVCMSLAQFFCAFATAATPAIYADCAIYSEYKTGINATGTIMGFSNVPIKIGVVTRGIAISAALAIGGFDASIDAAEASAGLMRGISLGFMVIPAVCLGVGAVIMIFGYKLTKEKIEEYSSVIASRRA